MVQPSSPSGRAPRGRCRRRDRALKWEYHPFTFRSPPHETPVSCDSPGACRRPVKRAARLGTRRGTFRAAKRIRRPAARRQAVGLLVLDQRQHHPRRHHGRPGGHAARGHRRRADHGGRSRRAARPRRLRRTPVAGTLQVHARRGPPPGPGSQHEQRRRLVRQRRALDHARTVHAVPRLDGNQRARRPAFRGRPARTQADGRLLSRHHRAGLPHAGGQRADREHRRQVGLRSAASSAESAARPGQVCGSPGRAGREGRLRRRSLRPVPPRPLELGGAAGQMDRAADRPHVDRPPFRAAAWNATN